MARLNQSNAVLRIRNPSPPTTTLQHPEFPGAGEAGLKFDEESSAASRHNRRPRVRPYSVTDLCKFTRDMSPRYDIIIPFIGLTSVGKSSLLKAILKLPPKDTTLPVGARMNVTVTTVVMLWET